MSYSERDFEEVLKKEALEYVLENQFEEVRDAVEDAQASEWLKKSADWLQLLNIISQHDRDQLRHDLRLKAAPVTDTEKAPGGSNVPLFDLASDVAQFLESLSNAPERSVRQLLEVSLRPLANYRQCYEILGDDLQWAAEMVNVTRAFREILFARADPSLHPNHVSKMSQACDTINAALERGKTDRLGYSVNLIQQQVTFGHAAKAASTPLSTSFAEWISDYLVNYSQRIDLGVCVECGKIFPRQRSDNAYCSKTCQNRVAYKRKKIFETGLLRKIEVNEKTLFERLQSGVWMYHPRYGIGRIQSATKDKRSAIVIVRFPHILRTFTWDIWRPNLDAAKMELYAETDAAALAELL